jgi:hypothetical protein
MEPAHLRPRRMTQSPDGFTRLRTSAGSPKRTVKRMTERMASALRSTGAKYISRGALRSSPGERGRGLPRKAGGSKIVDNPAMHRDDRGRGL